METSMVCRYLQTHFPFIEGRQKEKFSYAYGGHELHWEPSYIRQRMLPLFSTVFLREIASTREDGLLLDDQYEFHSIQRVKIRHGHPYYLVKWKKAANMSESITYSVSSKQSELRESELTGVTDSDLLDEPDVPQILIDDGCWFLLMDENMELVQAAFPKAVDSFTEEKIWKAVGRLD